jgi:hypothetical protein
MKIFHLEVIGKKPQNPGLPVEKDKATLHAKLLTKTVKPASKFIDSPIIEGMETLIGISEGG